jgi:hypothetical protein
MWKVSSGLSTIWAQQQCVQRQQASQPETIEQEARGTPSPHKAVLYPHTWSLVMTTDREWVEGATDTSLMANSVRRGA